MTEKGGTRDVGEAGQRKAGGGTKGAGIAKRAAAGKRTSAGDEMEAPKKVEKRVSAKRSKAATTHQPMPRKALASACKLVHV